MLRKEWKVASDGSGDFGSVQEAIDAVVPLCNKQRIVINVMPGVYKQPLYVAKTKNLITLRGFSPEHTILTWDNTATNIRHHQASRVIGTGTFACGSVIIEGEDFIAENITFENSACEGSGQAVALRVTADRCAFYCCRFLGWQDTLYLHYGKHYLRDCYVEGSVDFIFGNSTALLEHCHVHCKSPGFITAHSRKSPQESTGYVFLRMVEVLIVDIRDMSEKDKLFYFLDGLQPWVEVELQRCDVQDLASAQAAAGQLVDYSRKEERSGKSKPAKPFKGKDATEKMEENDF
ncbi:hypothetical protein AMTR_s00010p00267890 [Amborella trichopoda]|uniref:Pectinesterase n=1 Tax=Amborella trichopoda TaxID=13333 RepID=W1NH90_AMBTC|nr:hypothetical protein AMTR_s00010p00267890 [Amborella trichopoda]